MKKFIMVLFLLILVGCTEKVEYMDYNNERYQVIHEFEDNYYLLYKESNLEDKADIVVFPVYEDVTCFSESSKIYDSYILVKDDVSYTLLEAINQGLIEATFFTNKNMQGFDCVSHEYVNDNIIYDLVYQGQDFEIVVERCYQELEPGENVTIYEDQLIFISTSDAVFVKYKVIYQGEYFSLSSAMSLQIISKLELLNTQISDFWFTETNCYMSHQICNSGSLDTVYVYQEKIYQVTFQNDIYKVMKNIDEPQIFTDDMRTITDGITSCVVGSSTNLDQYLVLYENTYYSFDDFVRLNAVSLEEIIDNGGSPCLDIITHTEID